jgi:hypothetical protein
MSRRLQALLDDVRQFMREEIIPLSRGRSITIGVESNILTYCISNCIDGTCGSCGLLVCVHAHTAEVLTKARLEERARSGLESLPW